MVNHFLDTDPSTENTEKEPILKAFPCHPWCPCPRITATPREPKTFLLFRVTAPPNNLHARSATNDAPRVCFLSDSYRVIPSFIVLLLRIYHNREDSAVIARSASCDEAIPKLEWRLLRSARNDGQVWLRLETALGNVHSKANLFDAQNPAWDHVAWVNSFRLWPWKFTGRARAGRGRRIRRAVCKKQPGFIPPQQ